MDNQDLNFWHPIVFEEDPFIVLDQSNAFFKRTRGSFMAVYGAYCSGNGRFYVGSTDDMRRRLGHHTRKLRKGIHENPHMQNTYNKYGKDSFTWRVLLVTTNEDDLLPIEQILLDVLKPLSPVGFNISPTAGSMKGLKWSLESLQAKRGTTEPMKIRDPEGIVHEFFETCKAFALKHNLTTRGVYGVIAGKIKEHRGWTLPNSEVKIHPVLVSLEDGEVKVPVIKDFCAKYNVPRDRVAEIIQGSRKIWDGWVLKGTPFPEKLPNQLIQSPSGEIFEVENKIEFAKTHGLNYFSFWNVLNGRNTHYKGWKIPSEPEYVISENGHFIKIDNSYNFCEENNISHTNLFRILDGSLKNHKGFSSIKQIVSLKVSEFSNN